MCKSKICAHHKQLLVQIIDHKENHFFGRVSDTPENRKLGDGVVVVVGGILIKRTTISG